MSSQDLLKRWNDAMVSALATQQPELSDEELEVVSGPHVRTGVSAGGVTSGPTCGCGTSRCSWEPSLC